MLFPACAENAPQDVLDPAGEVARTADQLWDITFGIAAVVFFVVEAALIYTVVKFRRRPGREAAQFHGNTRVEVILTVVPALILAGIAVPTVQSIFALAEEPEGALQVKLVGHRFWWEYQYTGAGVVTANELHIPTGRPVFINLEGALTDRVTGEAAVNHSYWIPRLSGTQDIIPGRDTYMTLEADKPGTYLGQCKEFCGLGHAYMRQRVIAHPPQQFQAWLQEQTSVPPSPTGLAAEGEELFTSGQFPGGPACASCHAADSTELTAPNTGPNLTHFASRRTFAAGVFENNEANLSAWLAGPADVKPGATMPDLGLTQEQIDALIAYLETRE
ncbi:MAG TPA: cytochrome c oxidase subunit II [Actinomycetota bacterium]|nr:cytochrome c oxidase subunit II [Actinomycetota bacterium]